MADDNNMPPLSTYLSRLCGLAFPRTHRSPSIYNKNITLVMGNPSADLDSFVSAVVLSYFYNHSRRAGKQFSESTTYVPILNLPAVKSSDLWRQRPEFAVALKAALGEPIYEDPSNGKPGDVQGGDSGKVETLERVITIADVLDDDTSVLHDPFVSSSSSSSTSTSTSPPHPSHAKQDLLLVDHNSPSIAGLNADAINSRFNVVGCIDHHVDEYYIPASADPRIVTTGIGSCTSLVVSHLREQGLWAEHSADPRISDGLNQITRLALAPILIDTSNLRATGDKCSDTDREAVRFLESVLVSTVEEGNNGDGPLDLNSAQQQRTQWDRTASYNAISSAKSNSLSLLTTQEAFDRDYKAWVEPMTMNSWAGTTDENQRRAKIYINIGITSLVKPLSWLVRHAGDVTAFVNEIETFTQSPHRDLVVFGMLTRTGDGRKEVVLLATDGRAKGVADEFGKTASEELQLGAWEGEGDGEREELLSELAKRFVAVKVWYIGDTSKSRKQVAPLLRGVVRGLRSDVHGEEMALRSA
ncbi:uncharacterized protein A1O9_09243 [Exophiala aquamarina CBS 119918]|uniref:DHHA2 domain-containing protein n=1 Tax=Exophiala aquamarina CBS 119918 TaxID=1182545 RepID=A0A072P4Q7_9EURO|nr:uncharacterized protein A1O9_09243 [Exophiala aquamarina CBS 119918]KEF54801.1 hypothetical protein A1O9_09243 [Exophiala aquamarina CBS 119918]